MCLELTHLAIPLRMVMFSNTGNNVACLMGQTSTKLSQPQPLPCITTWLVYKL